VARYARAPRSRHGCTYPGIPPGGRLRFEVVTNLPGKYKHGHCRIRLELLGGTFVESEDFTPD
jgi:hypothetical protein